MMRRLLREERGASAVIIVLCLVVLLGFVALAVDTGYMYTVRGQAQTAADAAALAAVRALQNCNAGSQDRAAAVTAAQNVTVLNKVDGASLALDAADITFGRYYPYGTGAEKNFVVTNVNPNSVKVIVHKDATRNGPIKTTFGAILGVSTVNIGAGAIASRDRRVVGFNIPAADRGRVIPVGGLVTSMPPVGGQVALLDAQSGSGNWGFLSMTPTGFTTTQNSSESTLIDQIKNGFAGNVLVDPTLGALTTGKPGILSGAFSNVFQTRIGQTVLIATYDTAIGVGSNITYHIIGFTAVRIESVVTTGPAASRGIFGTVVSAPNRDLVTDPRAQENCVISKIVIAS